MATASLNLEGLDTKLNSSDKAELQTFLSHAQQRSEIQSRTHVFADMCFKKCITGPIKSASLDRAEESCLSSCVERFMDISKLTVATLQKRA